MQIITKIVLFCQNLVNNLKKLKKLIEIVNFLLILWGFFDNLNM